jgi:energy-converting hydrogenase A subunit P
MSSSIWYLYEFVRKKWIKNFLCAKTEEEIVIPPKRYRKIPPIVEFPEKCISCGACESSCPSFAIEMVDDAEYNKKIPKIDVGACIACGNCIESCPTDVLEIGTLREETDGLVWNVPKYTNFIIDEELCVNCGMCAEVCPVNAIEPNDTHHIIDINGCIGCKRCIEACPIIDAIKTYDEKILKEKIEKSQNIKFRKNLMHGKEKGKREEKEKENEEKETLEIEIPRIVKSLCISCGNCVDVCSGKIDLKNYKVVECTGCMECLNVCPTTAMRVGEVIKTAKITDKCYIVNEDLCIGCRICYKVCNVDNAIAISGETRLPYINPKDCVRCSLCYRECPVNAIELVDTKEVSERYITRKIKDEFESIVRRDLEEFSKNYILSKNDIKKFAESKVKKV